MNTDIRIAITLRGHRKRKKLENLLGPGAMGYLLDLWIGVAQSRPDGILTGWNEADIALEASWTGKPEEFSNALMEAGFLDQQKDRTFVLHDWMEHQAWASGARDRSIAASKAAKAKWAKRLNKDADASNPQCAAHKSAYAPSPSPSPKPNNPSPEPETAPASVVEIPSVFSIPLNDGTFHGVTQADIDRFHELFPAVDIQKEIRGMIAWCEAKPKRRKTKRGVKAFMTTWISKRQDQGQGQIFDAPPASNGGYIVA